MMRRLIPASFPLSGIARLLLVSLLVCGAPARAAAAGEASAARAGGADWEALGKRSVELLQRYVRIDTTNPPADVRASADFLRALLEEEGIEVRLFASTPEHVNLLARLPANAGGREGAPALRPLMLLHHMDVVPVDAARWEEDPFGGRLDGGFVHGRGAMDMKALGVVQLQAFLELKRRNVPRERDVLLLASADEETGGEDGARWMLAEHAGELDPEYVLDEGGFGSREIFAADGRLVFGVSNVEKRVLWVRLSASGTAAHGSQPLPDNATERLQAALGRILAWRDAQAETPPPELRGLIDAAGSLADNKFTRAIRRDTISLTTLRAGVGNPPKVNVIPSSAEATLDCRLLPRTDPDAFVARLRELAGAEVMVETINLSDAAPASPADSRLFEAIRRVVERRVPGAVVAPLLIPYGTDSNAFRAAGAKAYGFLPAEVGSDVVASMHGDSEKFPAAALGPAVRLMFEILADVLAPSGRP